MRSRSIALILLVCVFSTVIVTPALAAPGKGSGNAFGLIKHADKDKKPKKWDVPEPPPPPSVVIPPGYELVSLRSGCDMCTMILSVQSYTAEVGRIDGVTPTTHYPGGDEHSIFNVMTNLDPWGAPSGYAFSDPVHRIVYAPESAVVVYDGVEYPIGLAAGLMQDYWRTWTVTYRLNEWGGWVVTRFVASPPPIAG